MRQKCVRRAPKQGNIQLGHLSTRYIKRSESACSVAFKKCDKVKRSIKRKGAHTHLIKKRVCQQKSMKCVIPRLMQICRPHSKPLSRSVAYETIQCIFMSLEDAWDKILAFPECASLCHRVYSFIHFSGWSAVFALISRFPGCFPQVKLFSAVLYVNTTTVSNSQRPSSTRNPCSKSMGEN